VKEEIQAQVVPGCMVLTVAPADCERIAWLTDLFQVGNPTALFDRFLPVDR
jgi:hypothetical protein